MTWTQQFKIIVEVAREKLFEKGERLSHGKLEDRLGVSKGKVSHWKRGQVPSVEDMGKISKKLGFTTEWLVFGTEPKFKYPDAAEMPGLAGAPHEQREIYRDKDTFVHIPPNENIRFTQSWMEALGDPTKMQWILCPTNDMAPTLEKSDRLIVDQSQTEVVPNAIYAVKIHGITRVGRLHQEKDQLVLSGDNPAWDRAACMAKAQSFTVMGRVIWVCRDLL